MVTLNRNKIRRVIAGVDWGYSNPGCILVFAVDNDLRMYLVHEVYQTHQLIGWWTDQAVAAHTHFNIEAFACDPAEPAFIQQFQQAGLNALAGYNEIMPGVQLVQSRLKSAGDTLPRLCIAEDALTERDENLQERRRPISTLHEFDEYVWPKGIDGKAMKEKPVDDNNHGLDALRYAVAYVDGIGRGTVELEFF